MAQYEFKAPDGKTYLFKGPSGLTQSDVDLFGKNYFGVEEPQVMPAAPVKKAETGFIPSIKRGAAQTGVLLGDILPAMAGKAVGADEYAAQQLQEAAKSQEEITKKYPAEVPSYTDIKGVGDALVYAKEAVGEALPSLIPSLFTGGAAAIAGRGAVAAAQAAAEKAVLAQAAKGLAGEELKQAATQAGIQAARQTALKYEAGGALAGSAAQNIPDVYQNIYEATGQQDLGTAIAFGSFNAVLDAVTPVALLRKAKLSGIGPEELGAAWYKRAGKGVAQGFFTEGGTEALQEASSAAAESFVDQNRGFFTPQNFERFINAGLKGGLGGAGITGATDIVFGKGPEAGTEGVIKTKGLADVEVPTDSPIVGTTKVNVGGKESVKVTRQDGSVEIDGVQVTPPTDVDVAPQVAPTLAPRNVSGFEISPEGTPVAAAPTSAAPATEVDLLVEEFNKRAEEIKTLKQKKQDGTLTPAENGMLIAKNNKQRGLKYKIESLQATQKGAPDVGPTDTTAGGTSVPVAQQPDTVIPTEGLGEADGLGVVPARQDVVQPVAGEGEQQASVEEKIKFLENELVDWSLVGLRPEDDPRVQAVADELAALKTKQGTQSTPVEEFEDVPDFVVSYDQAATQKEIDEISATLKDPTLGLRQREALEERLDELLARQTTEEAPVEEEIPSGPETPEAVETETQGQEEPAAEPTVEVTPEEQQMYEDTREYHNGIEPDARLHLPEFGALSPEEKQVYFEGLATNNQPEHDIAAEKLSAYLAETQGIKPENVPQTKPLPKFVEEQLDKNNGNAFLNYLRTSAQDPVHRVIAQALYKLKLNTKVEIVQGLPNNRPAEYDPKTDTIRMTKEGQTETVLLHEFAHAGTIRVLHTFEESTGKLSQKQEDGAVHLDYLMNETRKDLAEKYPAAYKNIYEFVSYAVTDRAFQKELQRIQIPASNSLWGQVKNAWSNFVKAIAQVLGVPDTVGARNALIETFGAFEYVMSAAPKGGIEMKPLPTETKQAETLDESTLSDQELADRAESEVQLKEHGGKAFFRNLFTKKGGHWLATMFQNERYPIKLVEDRAKLFGMLQRIGPDLNNVYGQITRSAGVAVDLYDQYMRTATEDTHAAVEAYAAKAGLSIRDALERLHIILEAKHEPERRFVKYLKTIPLEKDSKRIKFNGKEYSADSFREAVMRELSKPFYEIKPEMTQEEINELDQKRKEYALDLRAALEKVVADQSFWAKQVNGKATTPQMFDVNSELYNVIAQRTPRQIAAILKSKVTPETEPEIEAVSQALKRVTELSIQLNKMANYHSQPTSNVIDFYNFQNYVPFKGKKGFTQIDDEFNIDSRRIGGDLQEGQNPFTGRLTESENPLLQALADGAGAAMRAGRKDLTLAIKNAVKDKLLIGKVKDKIKFEDRFLGDLSKQDIGGDNKIFHYNNDGTIDVIELNEPKQREAIRRSYRTTQPLIDTINMITSGIGQTHTRYNPAFAPMNFVRDALTNAFTLGAELGPAKAGQLLTAVASDVAGGGMFKSIKFSSLYSKGKFDKIRELAAKDQYYADLLEYIQLGGKVSYLQGLAAKGALDGLMKEIGRSGVLKTKDQIDKFIDIYNDMFELSSRAATYRMLKDQFFAENKKSGKFKNDADALADAKIQAVEYAKNLANFEQVGRWGKEAGALFMFFRPAATGAVRAIEALAPAFRLLPPGMGGFDEAAFREEAVAQGRTPEQIDKAVKKMMQEANNAAYMATGLIGVGVAMYMMALMMAGEDEEGRNKVVTDDMARWTRNARFHIPGTDIIIQIPWGFGLGAFAAAGAQIASIGAGKTSLADAFSNVATIGLDSFLPLPISRISPIDNFPAFAMDSITPSAFRPFFEYVMNLDGLGREIYNNRQSRFGDAYTGGDNIPEMYKKAARELFDATNGAVDWSPNTMYFFASNYFDGMAKMASSATNVGLSVAGEKEFDLKNDVVFISSFIGSKSNIDAREFSSVEKKVQELEKRINALKDRPEQLDKFMDANPDAYAAVQFYNSQVNGSLRQIRAAANQVRASKELSIKERKEQLKELTTMSNQVKHQLVLVFEDMGIKP